MAEIGRTVRLESVDVDQFYTEDQLSTRYRIQSEEDGFTVRIKRNLRQKFTCSHEKAVNFFTALIPILAWLPKYDVRGQLPGDLIAGFTVGVVHLPQGMAYGMLTSLPPIHGLYVSFFPVLVYAVMGTVRQVSIGTFAVICIMIGEVVDAHAKPEDFCNLNSFDTETTTGPSGKSCEDLYLERKIEIATALCVAVGILQILMYFARLGVITTYLSGYLVSGFTCGSAFHVLTSQVSKLLGITVSKYSGPFSLVYTYIDIFSSLTDTNWATVIVSTICILVLVAGKEINARFHDKIPIPIPWEFAVVIFSTIASHYGLLYGNHGVSVVGDIPTGLRVSVPHGGDILIVMLEAIPIAVVAYAIEISLGKMFALKHTYNVDSNQELMALGTANVFSSFFCCFPCAASLSRSVIWDEVGGKTQITGMVSSSLVLIILLWLGPLFEALPQAALAAIIVVNLKTMLRQFERIPSYWRVNKLDSLTWIVTWSSVVLLGVDFGLLVGVIFQLLTVVINTQIMNGAVLAEVEETGNYKNAKKYETRQGNDKTIVIFSLPSPLYFANCDKFTSQLTDVLGFDPAREASLLSHKKSEDEKVQADRNKHGFNNLAFTTEGVDITGSDKQDSGVNSTMDFMSTSDEDNNGVSCNEKNEVTSVITSTQCGQPEFGTTHVILDMSACAFLDNDGVKTIKTANCNLRAVEIELLLCSCTERMRRSLDRSPSTANPPYFLSLERAMSYARGEVVLKFDDSGNIIGDIKIKRRGTIF